MQNCFRGQIESVEVLQPPREQILQLRRGASSPRCRFFSLGLFFSACRYLVRVCSGSGVLANAGSSAEASPCTAASSTISASSGCSSAGFTFLGRPRRLRSANGASAWTSASTGSSTGVSAGLSSFFLRPRFWVSYQHRPRAFFEARVAAPSSARRSIMR